MPRLAKLAAIVSLAFAPLALASAPPDSVGVEISAAALEAALDSGAQALDARSEYSHKASRLAGARSAGLPSAALRDPSTLRPLPKAALEEIWAKAGIRLAGEIAVYGDETPKGIEEAYFAAFALRLAGADKVSVISRGFSAIEMEGLETEAGEPSAAPASRVSAPATVRQTKIAEALALAKSERPPVFVDFRSREDFERGHIPGALSAPFEDMFAEDGSLKGRESLERVFAGLPKDRPALAYCFTGLKSAGALPILEKLGFEASALEEAWNGWKALGLPVQAGR